jgi:uncharacterized protein (DUF983 family)
MALTSWQPPLPSASVTGPAPSAVVTSVVSSVAAPNLTLGTAVGRGLRGTCPACGKGKLFDGWLRVVKACSVCAAPLGLARSDDLPPYITILLTGHIVVPLMLWTERAQSPEMWVMAAIFVPLTLALTLAMMRPVKGATVGLMLKLGLCKETETA